MRATEYHRVGASLVMGFFVVLTLSACGGGGGDEEVEEQVAVAPGGNTTPTPPTPTTPPAPGGDADGSGSGVCSAAGRPDASRRALSAAERRALVASCNGAGAGIIDIDLNFLLPPPVPASGAKN